MSAVSEFFHMGGYAFYVWGSYGVLFALLLVEVVMLRRRRRQVCQRIARMARINKGD